MDVVCHKYRIPVEFLKSKGKVLSPFGNVFTGEFPHCCGAHDPQTSLMSYVWTHPPFDPLPLMLQNKIDNERFSGNSWLLYLLYLFLTNSDFVKLFNCTF